MTDTYSIMREFADSWFLIAMFAFRRGSNAIYSDAADVVFRHEDMPADSHNPEDRT